MSVALEYKCESPGCGKTRGNVNHWFAVRVYPFGTIEILPWSIAEERSDLGRCNHFCGQTHALQFVSNEMGKGTK